LIYIHFCTKYEIFSGGNAGTAERKDWAIQLYNTQIQHMIGTRAIYSPYSVQIALLVRHTLHSGEMEILQSNPNLKIKRSTTV
jgi:hypothetical protein